MQEKLNIAVFVDYDNIEIGVKSTLRREFDVSLALDALKERGDIVAKFAYANWGRQEGATREMAENAVQMVQRIPSPRGDKNGADINLALDALEMAFTHSHINAFAIISGDSDFIPLVNKLKEYGKTVFVVGGKAFTSTILQQNCHEFVSYEAMLMTSGDKSGGGHPAPYKEVKKEFLPKEKRQRPAPLPLEQAMPLVERALQVLERRGVQPQLGLLKSTMLQLDSTFSERGFGAGSFSEFVERLKKADLVNVSGHGGRVLIEQKGTTHPERPQPRPEEALPMLRDVLETHRMELEEGAPGDELAQWVAEEQPNLDWKQFGFQEFAHFLNYAQDKLIVRVEPHAERGLVVYLGAEFYPPAAPPAPPQGELEVEEDEPQPFVEGQPTIFEPNPPPAPAKAVKKARAPRTKKAAGEGGPSRRPRRKKTD